MPDRPTDNPGPPSGGDPEKTLHDLLAALANVGEGGASGPERAPSASQSTSELSPVDELRTALDRLFDLVRAERAEARAEIAELEAALAIANARIRQLEAGEALEAPAPPPNDFNQLREAAERLRQRTQELFRDAGAIPAGTDEPAEVDEEAADGEARNAAVEQADAGTLPGADESADAGGLADADEGTSAEIASIEAFTKPTVLRVFPGPAGPEDDFDLEVESDLAIEDDILGPPIDVDGDDVPEGQRELAVAAELPVERELAVAVEPPVTTSLPVEDELSETTDASASADETTPVSSSAPGGPSPADADASASGAPGASFDDDPGTDRTEPIEIAPRPARKRRAGLRRRRIDARKLQGVDPATALRAMVTSIDEVWTANVTLDLAIALTDGGVLKVTGGHTRPLSVNWVEPGTPARSTITATTSQLVPLFGRLELTDDQSAPMIHGPRRDADLLVGWIDRAQRLTPEPL